MSFVLPAPYTQVTEEIYAEAMLEIGGTRQACRDLSPDVYRGFA
jgi:hypothetical protein